MVHALGMFRLLSGVLFNFFFFFFFCQTNVIFTFGLWFLSHHYFFVEIKFLHSFCQCYRALVQTNIEFIFLTIVGNRMAISKQLGKLIKETTYAPDWLSAMNDECTPNNIPVELLTHVINHISLADKRLA